MSLHRVTSRIPLPRRDLALRYRLSTIQYTEQRCFWRNEMTTASFTQRSLPALLAALVLTLLAPWASAAPQALGANPSNAQSRPFVVEYYYKVKWGHAE